VLLLKVLPNLAKVTEVGLVDIPIEQEEELKGLSSDFDFKVAANDCGVLHYPIKDKFLMVSKLALVEIWVPWKVVPMCLRVSKHKGGDYYPCTLLYDSNFTLT
jgi:hypothetical protein